MDLIFVVVSKGSNSNVTEQIKYSRNMLIFLDPILGFNVIIYKLSITRIIGFNNYYNDVEIKRMFVNSLIKHA